MKMKRRSLLVGLSTFLVRGVFGQENMASKIERAKNWLPKFDAVVDEASAIPIQPQAYLLETVSRLMHTNTSGQFVEDFKAINVRLTLALKAVGAEGFPEPKAPE